MSNARFAKLVDLARTTDSEQRRELLREVTDLFFETSTTRSTRETALFDDVLQLVAAEMQDSVLVNFQNCSPTPPTRPSASCATLQSLVRDRVLLKRSRVAR